VNDCSWDRADLLRITPEAVLTLDPIIFSTPREVLSSFGFEEEVASMEVTVRVPQRGIWAVARVGQDDELHESASGTLVGGGGSRGLILGLDREETI